MDSEQFYTVLDRIDFDFEKHLTIRSMLLNGLFHDRNSDEPCVEITDGPEVPYEDYSFETVRGKLCERCFGTMACVYRKDGKTQALSVYDLKEDFSQYASLYQTFQKLLPKVKDILSLVEVYEKLYVLQATDTSYVCNKKLPEGHISGFDFKENKKVLFIAEVNRKAEEEFLKVEKQILADEATNFESFFKKIVFRNFASFKNFLKTEKAFSFAKDVFLEEVNNSEEKFLLFFKDTMQIPAPGAINFGIWLKHFLISNYETHFDVKSKSYLFEVPLIIKELLDNLPPNLLDNSIPFVLPTETKFTKELFENFKGLQDLNNINTVDDFKEAVFVAVNV